jgi:DNA-binding CsgD family transcriptional regulator
MTEKKRTIVERKSNPDVDVLLRNFDRAADHEKLDFESVLLEAARKAEQEGRVADAIKIKLRLLENSATQGHFVSWPDVHGSVGEMREVADLNELSAKQKRVAELLAAGFTRAEAAKRAGVGERTVYVWLNSEAFRAHIRAEQARLAGSFSRLRRSVLKAIAVLEAALDGDDEDRKLLAARALLSAGARFLALLETAELHERLEKLEQRLVGVGNELN